MNTDKEIIEGRDLVLSLYEIHDGGFLYSYKHGLAFLREAFLIIKAPVETEANIIIYEKHQF